MRVLVWVLVWTALLGLAVWLLWRRLRQVWAKAGALGEAVAEAEEAVAQGSDAARAAAADQAAAARPAATPRPGEHLAVFRDPIELAAERIELRDSLREERHARSAERQPGWARRVDSTDDPARKADR